VHPKEKRKESEDQAREEKGPRRTGTIIDISTRRGAEDRP
jgi:hypothetical protein